MQPIHSWLVYDAVAKTAHIVCVDHLNGPNPDNRPDMVFFTPNADPALDRIEWIGDQDLVYEFGHKMFWNGAAQDSTGRVVIWAGSNFQPNGCGSTYQITYYVPPSGGGVGTLERAG